MANMSSGGKGKTSSREVILCTVNVEIDTAPLAWGIGENDCIFFREENDGQLFTWP